MLCSVPNEMGVRRHWVVLDDASNQNFSAVRRGARLSHEGGSGQHKKSRRGWSFSCVFLQTLRILLCAILSIL